MPADGTRFFGYPSIHNPRPVETHIEVPLDIPADSRTNARNRCLATDFPGQRIVGRAGEIVEQQASHVTFAGTQHAPKVG